MIFKSALRLSAGALAACLFGPAMASSHMDAPAITLDDPANTTDVYAFLSEDESGRQYLTTALAVYPFEEPGIGPNAYRFDDDVLYSIHVATGDDLAKGRATHSYDFRFKTEYVNDQTILQSYLGELAAPAPGQFADNQNLRQTYSVTKVTPRKGRRRYGKPRFSKEVLGRDLVVPPNNQGLVTPLYNQGNDGNRPAKEGVASEAALDAYTRSGVLDIRDGYRVFAGQRDDGFYADIQSIFDLDFSFSGPAKPFDSQGGYNVHTIVLNIPLDELKGAKIAGVYATTSRPGPLGSFVSDPRHHKGGYYGQLELPRELFKQVGRQGNPLFVEALLPIAVKDRYNQKSPRIDEEFRDSAANPQLAAVLNSTPLIPGLLEAIYIPDLIKIDLTTGPTTLAGDDDFNRLSVFGGDTLPTETASPLNLGGFVPAGWPNGRRFGDDVVDIAVIAIGAAGAGPFDGASIDGVDDNEITYNRVFPYAATPLNGRNHGHHGEVDGAP